MRLKPNGTAGRGVTVRGEVDRGAVRGVPPGRMRYPTMSPNHLEMLSLQVMEIRLLPLLRCEPRLGLLAFDQREVRLPSCCVL